MSHHVSQIAFHLWPILVFGQRWRTAPVLDRPASTKAVPRVRPTNGKAATAPEAPAKTTKVKGNAWTAEDDAALTAAIKDGLCERRSEAVCRTAR